MENIGRSSSRALGRRKIEAWIAIKETIGHEREAGRHTRLDRKVLKPGWVVQTKDVPRNNILIFDGAALFCPG